MTKRKQIEEMASDIQNAFKEGYIKGNIDGISLARKEYGVEKSMGMKVLYRPQRGSLEESMEKLKEFDTVEDLLNWLCEHSEICGKFAVEDINFSYYCYDERIDWQTYIVTINKWGEVDYLEKYHSPQAIGFMTFKY